MFFFSFVIFSIQKSDLSEFPFPSVSACPSLASSPVVARRDSILKHSGSVKNTDRRVSIKQNQPIVLEYLSEKRQTVTTQSPSLQSQSGNGSMFQSNARPASLVLKGDRALFKLIRTPSIDQDQDDATVINTTNFTDSKNMQSMNTNHHLVATETNAKDDDDEDESAPLVQNSGNESTKSGHTSNHS